MGSTPAHATLLRVGGLGYLVGLIRRLSGFNSHTRYQIKKTISSVQTCSYFRFSALGALYTKRVGLIKFVPKEKERKEKESSKEKAKREKEKYRKVSPLRGDVL